MQYPYPTTDGMETIGDLDNDGNFKPHHTPWTGWTILFGDASGGRDTASPRLRRVGCGLVQIDWDTHRPVAARGWSLAAEPHTVSRGELVCFKNALVYTQCHVLFVTDNDNVMKGWQERRWRNLDPCSADADVWADIRQQLALKPDRMVNVIKVESHLTEAERNAHLLSDYLLDGNDSADTLAGVHAARIAVPAHLRSA